MAINPYAAGALKEGVHDRLVADLDNYAKDAAILPKWIMTPLAESVNPKIVEWVKGFHRHETAGLCLTGDPSLADDAIAAIAGALVRNFIRARVFTINQAIEASQDGSIGDPSCLLVPNFFMGKALGSSVVDWRLQMLYDTLYSRHLLGRKVVLFVSDINQMGAEYGASCKNLIVNHYDLLAL